MKDIIEKVKALPKGEGMTMPGKRLGHHQTGLTTDDLHLLVEYIEKPQDAILFCPKCKEQHIDKAEPDVCALCGGLWGDHHHTTEYSECKEFKAWLNPPHKKHRCHNCNHVWKPLAIPTNGVEALKESQP